MPLTPEEIAAATSPNAPTGGLKRGSNKQNSSIDLTNAFIRQQPWYQDWFKTQGLDPNRVKLSDTQRKQLAGVLAQHGLDLKNTDGMNIDPSGNINDPHGWASQPTWAKALEIAATVGAGAIAAPALIGALGAGGTGTGGAALGTEAAGTGAIGTGLGVAPASIGAASLGGGGVAGLGGAASTLGTIGSLASKGKSAYDALGGVLGDAGKGIGAATTAAGQNRVNQGEFDLSANSAYENELMNRARQEEEQRSQAGKDVYRANFFENYKPSPYDPTGGPKQSQQYMDTLKSQAGAGADTLSKPAQYSTGAMPALTKAKIAPASTLEQIGSWAGPAMNIASKVPKSTYEDVGNWIGNLF